MDLLEVVNKFQLKELDATWVETVFRDDFSVEKELPPEYEILFDDVSLYDLMLYLNESIKSWLNQDNNVSLETSRRDSTTRRKSWQTLIDMEFEYKSLITVISTFIKLDYKELQTEESRRSALAASRLYFIFLSVHGAQIFNVYNPILFGQAVEILRITSFIDNSSVKPPAKKKNKKKEEMSQETEEENSTPEIIIRDEEKQKLIKSIGETLKDLYYCLKNLSLANSEEVLVQTIQALVSIIKLEKSSSTFFSEKPKSNQKSYLTLKAYKILQLFCTPIHGEQEDVFRLILSYFLTELSFKEKDLHSNTKTKSVVSEHILLFIFKVVEEIKQPTHQGVKALIQQLCIRTPEKADVRGKCVQQIFDILNNLPYNLFSWCVKWIVSLSHSDGVKNRLTAVEIIAKLLSASEREDENEDKENENVREQEENDFLQSPRLSVLTTETIGNSSTWINHKVLLSVIISRCLDSSPTIRAKSLGIFAHLIMSKNDIISDMMLNIFVHPYKQIDVIERIEPTEHGVFNFQKFFNSESNDKWPKNPLPGGTVIVNIIEKLTNDDKVFVRKASLLILVNICKLSTKWITIERIDIFVQSCKDVSVLVRKLMSQSLTDLLLMDSTRVELQKAWVAGIIPLISDNDLKSQEKIIEVVGNVILDNMVKYNLMSSCDHLLPWKLITFIYHSGMRGLLRFVCKQWAMIKRVGSKEMDILKTHIGTENNLAAWFLLVCITEFQSFNKPNFILEYYFKNIHGISPVDEYHSQLVIEAVHLNWRECDREMVQELYEKLKVSLEKFCVPYTLISRSIDICTMYNKGSARSFATKLIQSSQTYIKKFIEASLQRRTQIDLCLVQHIFTLGESIQLSPNVIEADMLPLLHSLINMNDANSHGDTKINGVMKAVTIVTLGKICLQNELIAKDIVPTFGGLLDKKNSTPVKINTLIVLTDLCVRFTSIVESYIGDIYVCLKDSDPKVRRTTLTLITQLIQEDFVKLKCPFLFYLLCMIVDSDNIIRENTKAFLINTILVKNPKIMSQMFVQGIFFYNDYYENMAVNQLEISANEKTAFCLSGKTNRDYRKTIYKFMLEHMEDEHKFRLTNQICIEVLDKVCEEIIPLDSQGQFLLQDALFALACEDIRISRLKGGKEDEEERLLNGDGLQNIIQATLKSQLMKKIYIETALPIILKLKPKLSQLKSPLLRDLMVALKELMKDYKDEIDEIIGTDTELAAEVALDLRNLEDEPEDNENGEEGVHHLVMKEVRIICEKIADDIVVNGGGIFNSENNSVSSPPSIGQPSALVIEPSTLDNCGQNIVSPKSRKNTDVDSSSLSSSRSRQSRKKSTGSDSKEEIVTLNGIDSSQKKSSVSPSFTGATNSTRHHLSSLSPSFNNDPLLEIKSNSLSCSYPNANRSPTPDSPSPNPSLKPSSSDSTPSSISTNSSKTKPSEATRKSKDNSQVKKKSSKRRR